MLNADSIAFLRLQNQHIREQALASPQALVSWHGAMQAQDYNNAKWAVGLRLLNGSDAIVENAVNAGEIIRTHVLRPTWHLVTPADLRWMLRLSAPQIFSQSGSRRRELGLDASTLKKSNDLIARALEGGKHLTREEIFQALEQGGITTDQHRIIHIMMQAELDGVVCSGARRGKEQTYALIHERVAPAPMPAREEQLALLARRYFISHAPATLQDFAWWSGLKTGDAKTALEMIKPELKSFQLDALTYWMPKEMELPEAAAKSLYLLPAFDEFLISYKERGASIDPAHTPKVFTVNGIFKPVVVVNGRVAGIWTKTEKRQHVELQADLFTKLSDKELSEMEHATARFGAYLGKNAQVSLKDSFT